MVEDKEHKWLESDFDLLFNSLKRIIYNQKQLINGIIALAKKEGLEVSFKDTDNEITFEGDTENEQK